LTFSLRYRRSYVVEIAPVLWNSLTLQVSKSLAKAYVGDDDMTAHDTCSAMLINLRKLVTEKINFSLVHVLRQKAAVLCFSVRISFREQSQLLTTSSLLRYGIQTTHTDVNTII